MGEDRNVEQGPDPATGEIWVEAVDARVGACVLDRHRLDALDLHKILGAIALA